MRDAVDEAMSCDPECLHLGFDAKQASSGNSELLSAAHRKHRGEPVADRYAKIRKALAMEPTPGPWELKDGRTDTIENAQGYPVCAVHHHPYELYGHGVRAAYISACDPDTIRELLDERDALREALGKILENEASDYNEIRALVGGNDFTDMVERVAKLQAENERLRKDAERYRWLREHGRYSDKVLVDHADMGRVLRIEKQLDEIIDAEMQRPNT